MNGRPVSFVYVYVCEAGLQCAFCVRRGEWQGEVVVAVTSICLCVV